jgi:hypothetical protein
MISRILLHVLAAFAMGAAAQAQDVAIPEVAFPILVAEAAGVEGFVPAGWKIEHRQLGDLNGDGLSDLMFVLIDDDPKNLVSDASFSENPLNTNPRILAVALAQKSKSFKLVLQNHSLIPRIVEQVFEDPLQWDGSGISNGTMKVSLYGFGGSIWQPVLQFRYSRGHFELIGCERSSHDRFSGITTVTSANYLTGRVEVTTGSIENDVTKTVTKKMKKAQLPRLEDIGNGLDFEPQVP